MNIEYTYLNGNVIISDEQNRKKQCEYYDNLDNVLVQENLIETMEEIRKELAKESETHKKYTAKYYTPFIFPVSAVMTTIGAPFMLNWLTNTNSFNTTVNTVLGPMSNALAFSITMSTCVLPLAAAIEIRSYMNYKDQRKRENGIFNELNFIENQLKIEKGLLKTLKQEKTRNNEKTEFRTVKVDDSQQLAALQNWLNLYFDLGYNESKYYQYYQQGQLTRKLSKNYNASQIKAIEQHLQESR